MTSQPQLNGLEIHDFESVASWESWLSAHHDTAPGVWLRIAKQGSPRRSVTVADALEVALCYGWIDSHRKGNDDTTFFQKYSPRRARSSWSQVNVATVEALIAAGRMRAAGLREVDAAKADGRWDAAYESQRTATVPGDLAAALAGSHRARTVFESLGRTERYGLILRLLKARDPGDRASRLEKLVAELDSRSTAP